MCVWGTSYDASMIPTVYHALSHCPTGTCCIRWRRCRSSAPPDHCPPVIRVEQVHAGQAEDGDGQPQQLRAGAHERAEQVALWREAEHIPAVQASGVERRSAATASAMGESEERCTAAEAAVGVMVSSLTHGCASSRTLPPHLQCMSSTRIGLGV